MDFCSITESYSLKKHFLEIIFVRFIILKRHNNIENCSYNEFIKKIEKSESNSVFFNYKFKEGI